MTHESNSRPEIIEEPEAKIRIKRYWSWIMLLTTPGLLVANAIIVTSFIISDETKGECNTGNLVIPHLLVLLVTAIFLSVLFLIHFESSLTALHLGAMTMCILIDVGDRRSLFVLSSFSG